MSLLERMIVARRAVAEAMSGTAGDVQKTSQATQQWCQSSYGQPEVDGANVLVGTNEIGHTQSMIEELGPCRAQLPPRLTSERTSVPQAVKTLSPGHRTPSTSFAAPKLFSEEVGSRAAA